MSPKGSIVACTACAWRVSLCGHDRSYAGHTRNYAGHNRSFLGQVICLDSDFMQTELRVQVHKPYLQQMAKSVYCLILPGNSQSSQRLTEAFLTGCIPVFVGPPFHSLPFRNQVCVYASISLCISSFLSSQHAADSFAKEVGDWAAPVCGLRLHVGHVRVHHLEELRCVLNLPTTLTWSIA